MPQELSIYYKTVMTVDAAVAELAPEFDCLSDLPDFFEQAMSRATSRAFS